MNSLIRRLMKLEPPETRERPIRIVWNDGSEAARAEAARLDAEGFNVTLVGWQGRMDDEAIPQGSPRACRYSSE